MDELEFCEVCGQLGAPTWGGFTLCESCLGAAGATCAGIRKDTESTAVTPPEVC